MEIKQHFVVAYPREVVWEYFGRIDEVTVCMPGASLTEPAADGHVKFKLSAKLGPISAAFVGESDLERDEAAHRGVIRGSGRDNRTNSRAKGEVEYLLSPAPDGGTRVDIKVDFSLAGRLAQFSRGGIVNDLAARMTAQFAQNLEAALARAATAGEKPAAESAARPAAEPAPELKAGGLVLSVLWGRIRSWLGSWIGRG